MAVTQIRGNSAILDGSIYNAQLNASANIATSKLADGAKVAFLDGSRPLTADWALGSFKLTGLADPTSAQHAATKNYVDSVASGLDFKASVRVATTAALTLASAFENGDTVDGVVLATGNRILIKNQASSIANGIYTVNSSGAPTRATDADTNTEVTSGMFCFVTEGTTNGDTGWVLTTNDADINVGVAGLDFAQFTSVSSNTYTAGDGLTLTSLDFSVNVDGSTLEISSDSLRVKDAGVTAAKLASDSVTTLKILASNVTYAKIQDVAATNRLLGRATAGSGVVEEITVGGDLTQSGSTFTIANNAVTTAKINAGAVTAVKLASDVAGDGLASTSGVLSVNVDGVGIETNSDTLRLKDSGVVTAKINDAAVTSAKLASAVAGDGIAGGAGTALSVDWVNVTYTGNAVADTYALTGTPVLSSLMVFQNGLLMEGGGSGFDYGIVSTNVVFQAVPADGDKIRFCFFK